VAGATLQRTHNNEANDETKRRQFRRIFGYNHENEENITATLWLERRFNNDTGVRNWRKNRLEMFVRTGHDNDVMMWNWRWAACEIKIVRITNCRRQ
jgi:hypothetical protein